MVVNQDAETIVLNGKERAIRSGQSLTELLAELDLKEKLVVVERNGVIVPRGEFADVSIRSGDVLEIVHFVGGG